MTNILHNNQQYVKDNNDTNKILSEPIIPKSTDSTMKKIQEQRILSSGITPEQADQYFVNDIRDAENRVKQVLKTAGVTKIPQGVFDGLVSMQNQLGNITYAYIKGEKIDLTVFYKEGNWTRAASFIAADERDRKRRIKEAAMILKNNYGPTVNEDVIVSNGLSDAKHLAAKNLLNKQTGEPATDQQLMALATSYYATTGESLPGLSTTKKLAAAQNATEETIFNKNKKQAGPWPY